MRAPQSIFDLAVQYAFSGYSALSPLLFAALFWKRSTKWGALAVALWTASAVIYTARMPGALTWFGLTPVVHMTLISATLMIVVSLVTRPRDSGYVGEVSLKAGQRPMRYVTSLNRALTAVAQAFRPACQGHDSIRRLVDFHSSRGVERPRIERSCPLL